MGRGVAITENPDFSRLGTFFWGSLVHYQVISGEKLQTFNCSDIYIHILG